MARTCKGASQDLERLRGQGGHEFGIGNWPDPGSDLGSDLTRNLGQDLTRNLGQDLTRNLGQDPTRNRPRN